MPGKFFSLCYSQAFDEQCEALAEIEEVDDALLIITYVIARNPDAFPQVPGHSGIYIAKTNEYYRKGFFIPSLMIWYRKMDADMIEMLHIEPDISI